MSSAAERSPRVLARRRLLLGLAGTAGCAAAAGYSLRPPTSTALSRALADPWSVRSLSVDDPVFALTFDDGPDPRYTPTVLDVLGRLGMQATFFVVGSNATRYPDLVRRIQAEGHELANHTHTHLPLDAASSAVARHELGQCDGEITAAGAGPAGPWFRAPFGLTSRTLALSVRAEGKRSVFWTDAVEAHRRQSVPEAVEDVVGSLAPGDVLLAHDGGSITGTSSQDVDRSFTMDTLEPLLVSAQRRGLRSLTLSSLAQR